MQYPKYDWAVFGKLLLLHTIGRDVLSHTPELTVIYRLAPQLSTDYCVYYMYTSVQVEQLCRGPVPSRTRGHVQDDT